MAGWARRGMASDGIEKEDVLEALAAAAGPLLVLFRADACRRCPPVCAIAEKLARERRVAVLKVDAPASPELCELFAVKKLPAFVLLNANSTLGPDGVVQPATAALLSEATQHLNPQLFLEEDF